MESMSKGLGKERRRGERGLEVYRADLGLEVCCYGTQ